MPPKQEQEFIKVNKWDGTAVKNSLDDAVKEILTKKLNYVEDHTLMDGKLAICTVAVLVAMFAMVMDYFYPFPASWTILISCSVTYFILMGILTLYTFFCEKDIFVVALEKDPAGLDPDSTWEAASILKKYDDQYDLSLVFKDGKTGAKREEKFIKSVANFFDKNGLLCMDLLEDSVMKLITSLSNTKKDS